MEKVYDDTVKRLTIDSSVETYKSYLIGGFMMVEFVLGNFLNFDMSGFTQQQIIKMNTYERLLIEIGEKNSIPSGSQWPVEIRLLGIVIINAGIFIISKMIMKKTGANLINMMNNIGGSKNTKSPQKPKRRMRGPDIDLENISN